MAFLCSFLLRHYNVIHLPCCIVPLAYVWGFEVIDDIKFEVVYGYVEFAKHDVIKKVDADGVTWYGTRYMHRHINLDGSIKSSKITEPCGWISYDY